MASSGSSDGGNQDWKAVDGNYNFNVYTAGWDAADASPPNPPPSPTNATAIDWKWDGVNGNNNLWVGSTTGGLRLSLKGDDPLWQAGVPYDSGSSPKPPPSWANNEGGMTLFPNATMLAYSGAFALKQGQSVSFLFSIMTTPVKPLDWQRHWTHRWTQLGGAANYSYLASKGATVVNMHQGNAINPWISKLCVCVLLCCLCCLCVICVSCVCVCVCVL